MTERLVDSSFQAEVFTPATMAARHRAAMGANALTGFTLMEATRSPWQRVRDNLEAEIIDQQPAIDAIIDALDGSEARLVGDMRPRANLAFLGPTGVGKSQTAKVLAETLGEQGGNLIKIDCSNYSNGHEVAGLTGSPVGYVGYGLPPVLQKERVEKYGTVVLFDEIEKGSEELFNVMLQIMGDGQLALSDGSTAYFRNTVVILTSNLGAKEMSAQLSPTKLGFMSNSSNPDRKEIEQIALRGFEQGFKPEFINRIDKSVVFHPLTSDGLGRVLDTKLTLVNSEYEPRFGARLSLSDGVKSHLVSLAAQQPHMGARPLVRAFEQNVQTTFGRYLGGNQIAEGTHVKVFHPNEIDEASESSDLVFASARDESIRRTVAKEVVPVNLDDEGLSVFEPDESEESEHR